METVKHKTILPIKRRAAHVCVSLRVENEDVKLLKAVSRRYRTKRSDLLRQAWQEFKINHNLAKETV